MNRNKVSLAVLYIILSSCDDSINHSKHGLSHDIVKQKKGKTILLPDTVGSYKLDGIWIKPKSSFELNDPPRMSGDTLFLVTCANYVYYPFGKMDNKYDISESVLNEFNVVEIVKNDNGDMVKYYKASKDKNKILLFFSRDDNHEAYWGSYIVKGEIKDNAVYLINGIKVGAPANDFYCQFFEEFNKGLQDKIRVVVLEPCVSGNPKHIYYFKYGKITSILFKDEENTDSTVDY